VRCHSDRAMDVGFIPVHVEPPGRPVLADPARAASIATYVAQITEQAGLPPWRWVSGVDMVRLEP